MCGDVFCINVVVFVFFVEFDKFVWYFRGLYWYIFEGVVYVVDLDW